MEASKLKAVMANGGIGRGAELQRRVLSYWSTTAAQAPSSIASDSLKRAWSQEGLLTGVWACKRKSSGAMSQGGEEGEHQAWQGQSTLLGGALGLGVRTGNLEEWFHLSEPWLLHLGTGLQNVQAGFCGNAQKWQAQHVLSLLGAGTVAWDRVRVTLFWTGVTLSRISSLSGLSLPICKMDRNEGRYSPMVLHSCNPLPAGI